MENASITRSALFVAGALALAGAFFGGAAYAADSKFDQATELLTQAVALLKAAQNPDPSSESGGHRQTAIELLTRAESEIIKAKEAADKSKGPTPKDNRPTPASRG